MVTAVVDINDVYNYRSAVMSRSHQASAVEHYPRINVELSLGGQCELPITPYIEPRCVLFLLSSRYLTPWCFVLFPFGDLIFLCCRGLSAMYVFVTIIRLYYSLYT